MTFSSEIPEDPENIRPNEGGDHTEDFDTTDPTALMRDGVTADEVTEGDAGDIEDGLPSWDGRFDEAPGYDEEVHNLEAREFLDSLHPIDGTQPEVPEEERREALAVATAAAKAFIEQGPVHPTGVLGDAERMDDVVSNDGTRHELSVVETSPDMLEKLGHLGLATHRVRVQDGGDEEHTGRGVEYEVSAFDVTRVDIPARSRDIQEALDHVQQDEMREGVVMGGDYLLDVLGRVIGEGVANARQANRMGVGHYAIGADEAHRLAHLLLGRDVRPDEYLGDQQ